MKLGQTDLIKTLRRVADELETAQLRNASWDYILTPAPHDRALISPERTFVATINYSYWVPK